MRPHELALCWLIFGFLAMAASPSHFWLDSGEIAAAGVEYGVMHPTGVPGYVAILQLASALPIGSLGLRMAVVSSACMTGAIGLILAILRRRDTHWALVWVIGLWLPLGLTLVRQGRVVEIYGFAALLLMTTLWGFDPAVTEPDRVSRRGIGLFAAVIAVWGFGDLRLALVPPIVIAWVIAWRRAEPWARWAPLCVALASAVVLTIPLGSSRDTIADWGDPESWSGVWDHVQATLIRDSYAEKLRGMSWAGWLVHARLAVTRLVEDLGPFGLLLALGSLLFGLTRPLSLAARERERGATVGSAETIVDDDHRLIRWLTWIAVVELIYAVAINPMGGRDRQTGLALALIAGLALGLGIHRATENKPPLRWVLLPLLACGLWIPPAFESLADARVTRSWAPHEWTRELLGHAPIDALVLGQTDDVNAGIAAARALEGARPDLVAIPAQHLYRAPNEWQTATARRASVWAAAEQASGPGEWAAIAAVLGRWRGPVVLESPSIGVLDGVWLPGVGQPPWWIVELPSAGVAIVPPPRRDDDPLLAAIDRWRPSMTNPVDAERLADALTLWTTGEHARSPESPLRWLLAERRYKAILAVVPDHPRALIGLAAARDALGHRDDAIALTRRALELDPERSTALKNLAFYLSSDPSSLDEARELAELATQLAAEQRGGWTQLLLICQRQSDADCVARAEARLSDL